MAFRVLPNIFCLDEVKGHTISLSDNGELYSFGESGSYAHGHKDPIFLCKKISSLKNVITIACGPSHTVILDHNGYVFTFGSNFRGALGISKTEKNLKRTFTPQKVNLPRISQISCGKSFTLCVSEDQVLYSFGDNSFGQLGLGTNQKQYNEPQIIDTFIGIEFIQCGSYHSICKMENNDIYAWGCNSNGQIGIGSLTTKESSIIPCFDWPGDVIDIKCGRYHTLVLTSNQNVFSCGNNEYGQVGRDSDKQNSTILQKIEELSEIIRIECGEYHSMCIDIYNNFYIFGSNEYNQLGFNNKQISKPTKHPILLIFHQVEIILS